VASASVKSSVEPNGLAVGLGSGDGRDVAWRERSRILLVSSSMSIPDAPVYISGQEIQISVSKEVHHFVYIVELFQIKSNQMNFISIK